MRKSALALAAVGLLIMSSSVAKADIIVKFNDVDDPAELPTVKGDEKGGDVAHSSGEIYDVTLKDFFQISTVVFTMNYYLDEPANEGGGVSDIITFRTTNNGNPSRDLLITFNSDDGLVAPTRFYGHTLELAQFQTIPLPTLPESGYAKLTVQIDSLAAPEPEPSTFTLLSIGALGLIAYGRKQRKQFATRVQ
jgi:hypothetical protein